MAGEQLQRIQPTSTGDRTPAFMYEVGLRSGDWQFASKDSLRAIMRGGTATARYQPVVRVWACLQLATSGYQSQVAKITRTDGSVADLAPADITEQTGMSPQNVRRALKELEEQKMAQREHPLTIAGKKAKAPRIRVNFRPPIAELTPEQKPKPAPAAKILQKLKIRIEPGHQLADAEVSNILAIGLDYQTQAAAAWLDYQKQMDIVRTGCQNALLIAPDFLISGCYKEETSTETNTETKALPGAGLPEVVSECLEEERATHPPIDSTAEQKATAELAEDAARIRAAIEVAMDVELGSEDPIPSELAQLTAAEGVSVGAMIDFIGQKAKQKRDYEVWSPGALFTFLKTDFPGWLKQRRPRRERHDRERTMLRNSPDIVQPPPLPPDKGPWATVKVKLAEQLTLESFTNWFSRTACYEPGPVLSVIVPDAVTKRWIEAEYSEILDPLFAELGILKVIYRLRKT